MEKITKEELLAKVAAGEEERFEDIDQAKVSKECMQKCMKSFKDLYKCMKQCVVDQAPQGGQPE